MGMGNENEAGDFQQVFSSSCNFYFSIYSVPIHSSAKFQRTLQNEQKLPPKIHKFLGMNNH